MSKQKPKVCFVGIGAKQLSISLLSAVCKSRGWDTFLAYNSSLFNDYFNLSSSFLGKLFDETDKVLKKVSTVNPDLVAFSPLTATYQWSLEVARKIKERNSKIKIVFGGVHVSAIPNLAIENEFIDFVVMGEGEKALVEIVDYINGEKDNPKISNTLYKTKKGTLIKGPMIDFCKDLDSIPNYDQEIWGDYLNLNGLYTTTVSRGCPNKCSYCFNNFYSKIPEEPTGYLRFRSVENVVNELLEVKKEFNIKYIDFVDDSFTANKKWLRMFLNEYREKIDLPFQCLVNSKLIDKEIVNLLEKSGCRWVQMGVQSVDSEYKKRNLNRHETLKETVTALNLLRESAIKIKLDHMLGLPDEPIKAQEKALEIYKKQTPDRIQTFWITYLPGTEILENEYEKGRISNKELKNIKLGKSKGSHRNTANNHLSEKNKLYKKYELTFKILPILPAFLKKKISSETVKKIPIKIFSPFAFLVDLMKNIFSKNPDFLNYLNYYIHQLKRVLKEKII